MRVHSANLYTAHEVYPIQLFDVIVTLLADFGELHGLPRRKRVSFGPHSLREAEPTRMML